jgi:hypothetical protein
MAGEVEVRLLRVGLIVSLGVQAAAPAMTQAAPRRTPELPRRLVAVVDYLGLQGVEASNVMFAHIEVGSRHKGYGWSAVAYKERPSARTELTLAFGRAAAEDTQHQSSQFSWSLSRGALALGRKLNPAALRTGRGMGSNGSISMELGRPGQYVRTRLGGCTGWVEYRVAKLTGRLRVHLRDLYFRRLAADRADVFLYRAHDLRCETGPPPPPPCPDHLWLAAEDTESGVTLGIFRTEEGRVDEQVAVAGTSGDADAVHRISVQIAVPEAFEASEDLTSATVDADVAGPWLSGDLSYLAPPPPTDAADERCGSYRSTSGVVTGDFTAHFDSVGDVTPATTGMSATLRRQTS